MAISVSGTTDDSGPIANLPSGKRPKTTTDAHEYSTRNSTPDSPQSPGGTERTAIERRPSIAILRVCQTMYDEAGPILYCQNTYAADIALEHPKLMLSDQQMKIITI